MAEPTLFKDGYVAFTTATGSATYTHLSGSKSVEVPFSKAELANSVFGDVAETFFPGIISAPISIVYRQDFGAAGVDKTLWDRWNSETKFRLKLRPGNTTVSTTNPSYIFNRVGVFSISPINGAHGVLLENKAELRILSGGTLTRSTAT